MPRAPIISKPPATPALTSLVAGLSAGLVSAVLIAVAGAIVLIAGSFALYAELKEYVSPAAASAVTAAVFALIAIAIAVIAPALIRSRATSAKAQSAVLRPALEAGTVRIGVEVALALIGGVAEVVAQRRTSATKHNERKSHEREHNRGRRKVDRR